MSFKHYFTRTIGLAQAPLHFAAHSHHPWPDISLGAHQAYWELSARELDHKWSRIFGEIVPATAAQIAKVLNLPRADTLVFAPNTHELVSRILSLFAPDKPIKILTSDSEFMSFSRQLARLEEDRLAIARRIPTRPIKTFAERVALAAHTDRPDIIFLSHVFFGSGFQIPDLNSLVHNLPVEPLIVIDGYHAFMAMPVDLSAVADRILYLAGGYKYAMSGEGAAFLHVPPDIGPRPRDTGWFAGFDALEQNPGAVAYPSDARRFFGATFDASGIMRMRAVLEHLSAHGPDVAAANAYCRALQTQFLAARHKTDLPAPLVDPHEAPTARFLAFETRHAAEICRRLNEIGVMVDARGDCLRIGFGIYQDATDVERLLATLNTLRV